MPETISLPPAAQQLFMQLQTFQQQYQAIVLQKETMGMQKIETEKALEELAKVGDKEEVYKAVGPILVKSTKSVLVSELKEKKETGDLRAKSLETQEKKLKEKLEEIQGKLQSLLVSQQKKAA
ncbi:MAG: prefoldin subunit beta [Candidatus Aenigmarchaeota archaeon]|nr:prefoldin subunit beta [Candidatus Aenigmarchaeota archaeon]